MSIGISTIGINMEILPDNKSFKVSTKEPFGKLLLELMHGQSYEPSIHKVQKHVGTMLLSAYIDNKVDDAEHFGIDSETPIIEDDIAKDIATKVVVFANNNDVDMVFDDEYFEGLEKISIREAKDLPELIAEREVVAVAAEMGYIDRFGVYVDDQDVKMVEEEIEQAKAALQVLDLLKTFKNRSKS